MKTTRLVLSIVVFFFFTLLAAFNAVAAAQLSYQTVYRTFIDPASPLTAAQQEAEWTKHARKKVQWRGVVTEVRKGWLSGVSVSIDMGTGSLTKQDIILDVHKADHARALDLRKGSTIVFEGITRSQPGSVLPMSLSDARIFEVQHH